jgi:hypothetical protein
MKVVVINGQRRVFQQYSINVQPLEAMLNPAIIKYIVSCNFHFGIVARQGNEEAGKYYNN